MSQRGLKTAEEIGELAKVILPYDNAFATTHRFAVRQKILEEVIDSFLCLLSIADTVGATSEEIEEEMWRKAKKWDGLQVAASNIDPIDVPFEIHITVEEADVEKFRADCKDVGVKPILLDLHTRGNGVMRDLQTSSAHRGSNRTCYEEIERVANALTARGYKVVRKKAETVPWHPAAPATPGSAMPKDCYFEAHIPVVTRQDAMPQLQRIAESNGARMSRNVFKRHGDDGLVTVMVTLRKYSGTAVTFKVEQDGLLEVLAAAGFTPEKCITEFSIYDSRVAHDSAWINLPG